MNLIKKLCLLKSVLDNSCSRERETADPTCREAMRVQKNEQVFTNIIIKKTTMAIVSSLVGAIFSHFPHSFFLLPPFFFSPFPPFLFFPPPLFFFSFSPSHTPHPTFLFYIFFSLFLYKNFHRSCIMRDMRNWNAFFWIVWCNRIPLSIREHVEAIWDMNITNL